MRFLIFICIISSFFLLGACSNEKKSEFRNYELSDVTDSVELQLSDLLEDIRIVPLETDSLFLVSKENIVANEKYIVTLGKDAIHQFDAVTGKHIRKLAVSGRGPNEYGYINMGIIDNRRGILYFSHNYEPGILSINLETGEFLPTMGETSKKGWGMDLLIILSDGNICTHNDSLMFSVLDVKSMKQSRMIDSLITPTKRLDMKIPFPLGKNMGGLSILENHNEIFLYSQKFNDTVYRYYSHDKIEKAFSISHKDRFVDSKGVLLSLPYIDDRYILCSIHNLEMITSDDGSMNGMSSFLEKMALIDKDDHSVRMVNKVTYNTHSLNLKMPVALSSYGGFFTNSTIYAQMYEAYELKEEIEKTLSEQQLSDSDREYLERINSQLSEESNPVVFIGNRKK